MPDISALIAPRPQFVESGSKDVDYPVEPAYSMVKRAYELLGAGGNLEIDIFDGGHRFNASKSVPWMVEQLKNYKLKNEVALYENGKIERFKR
jgi:hypothetical protein